MTVISNAAAERRFRTYRAIGWTILGLGAALLLALIPAGMSWLGLLLAIPGFGLILSARHQLARSRYEPFVYDGVLDVVGESHYTKNIDTVWRAIGQDPTKPITAALLPDPTNAHDPHAVAVGLAVRDRRVIVGYLSRETAAIVRPALQQHLDRKVIPSVTATIRPFTSADAPSQLYTVQVQQR